MPAMPSTKSASDVLAGLGTLLPDLEALYKDVNAHPELSMQETRTAGIAAEGLRKAGYDVSTGIGKTGVVGVLRNGEGPTERVAQAFRAYFSPERVKHTGPAPASEDFGCFATAWQILSVYWFVGGDDPEVYAKAKAEGKVNDLPVNHSPHFAPVLHPTLETGVEALVVGALAWLVSP